MPRPTHVSTLQWLAFDAAPCTPVFCSALQTQLQTLDMHLHQRLMVSALMQLQNYAELFRRIASWLRPGGLLFFHIFVHSRGLPYHYEVRWLLSIGCGG